MSARKSLSARSSMMLQVPVGSGGRPSFWRKTARRLPSSACLDLNLSMRVDLDLARRDAGRDRRALGDGVAANELVAAYKDDVERTAIGSLPHLALGAVRDLLAGTRDVEQSSADVGGDLDWFLGRLADLELACVVSIPVDAHSFDLGEGVAVPFFGEALEDGAADEAGVGELGGRDVGGEGVWGHHVGLRRALGDVRQGGVDGDGGDGGVEGVWATATVPIRAVVDARCRQCGGERGVGYLSRVGGRLEVGLGLTIALGL
jgi:hypothetical protein